MIPRLGAIAIVLRNDCALLARRRNAPDAGLWGLPGGHVEWGETALNAAAREVQEETAITVSPVQYLNNIDLIQPPDLHYLLAVVRCTYISGTPKAGDDVSEAAWVPLADIRAQKLEMSARVGEMIDLAI